MTGPDADDKALADGFACDCARTTSMTSPLTQDRKLEINKKEFGHLKNAHERLKNSVCVAYSTPCALSFQVLLDHDTELQHRLQECFPAARKPPVHFGDISPTH